MRMIWSSETDLWEAFGSGDVWIAYAWPNDWVQMKKKGLKVVYMRPKEKPIAWVGMFMLLKGTSRYQLAHAYVDAWSSAKSGSGWRTTTATATRTRCARRRRATCCSALAVDQPEGRHRAERAPRPRHPAPRALRKDVGKVKAS